MAPLAACRTSGYAPARVAKPSVEEPDAAEPARPDLWGARVSNDPGLPDPSGVAPRRLRWTTEVIRMKTDRKSDANTALMVLLTAALILAAGGLAMTVAG